MDHAKSNAYDIETWPWHLGFASFEDWFAAAERIANWFERHGIDTNNTTQSHTASKGILL